MFEKIASHHEIGNRPPPEEREARFRLAFEFMEQEIIPRVSEGETLSLDQVEELANEFRKKSAGPGWDFKLIDVWAVSCAFKPYDEQEAKTGRITSEELAARGKAREILKQALIENLKRKSRRQPSYPRPNWVPSGLDML
jgi:hypothetical protein